LKRFKWHGKRYKPSGRVIVFHLPCVEPSGGEDGSESDEEGEDIADGKPAWADESMDTVAEPESDKDTAISFSEYYLYDEYKPLSDALHKHQGDDPPPNRQYFHVCNRHSITMGEWMLCSDTHGLPSSKAWWKRELDEVSFVCLVVIVFFGVTAD
jgi:hypothetical protein